MGDSDKNWSWTQPICASCYTQREPGRPEPTKLLVSEPEICVDCGQATIEGIYYKVSPAKAIFPTRTR